MHISVPVNNVMEYINATELSPLISKCQVKVCYVGQEPNRNGTVITKEVATEMGRKIPGSPVVGFYNETEKDFEGHNRDIKINGDSFEIIDTTKPYGFVPTDAKVWFQKFLDDGVEREYLCTECFIWTGAYPESQRVLQGNNQSMELDAENSNGVWAEDNNSGQRFFIYNEALIEKLCILGENVEPCFEGAQFKSEFSLTEELNRLNNQLFSMMTQLTNSLKEGGSQELMEKDKEIEVLEDENLDTLTPKDEVTETYNLEDIVEYQELNTKYEALKTDYDALKTAKEELDTEVATLRQFKLDAEHASKQNMIDSFYMLSDEDKKDVIDNIDNYSLDEIEAKLSVICVRNKVNFNLKDEDEEKGPEGLFNLIPDANDDTPAWVKAVQDYSENN